MLPPRQGQHLSARQRSTDTTPTAPSIPSSSTITGSDSYNPLFLDDTALIQCEKAELGWSGGSPPYDVYVRSADTVAELNTANASAWELIEDATPYTLIAWTVDIPGGRGKSVRWRVDDSDGLSQTSATLRVGTRTGSSDSSDTSCLRDADRPPAATSAVDINYNYNFNNGRLLTSIIAAAVVGGVTLIAVLVVVCVCRRRSKRRDEERRAREAEHRPLYAQFFAYPGAPPQLYVQLMPGAPYVPAGAEPPREGTDADATGLASAAAQPLLSADREAPLSRSATPVPAPMEQASSGAASNSDPDGAVASSQIPPAATGIGVGPGASAATPSPDPVLQPRPMPRPPLPPNAVASGSGTRSDAAPPSAGIEMCSISRRA